MSRAPAPVIPEWYDRLVAALLSILVGFSVVALPFALLRIFAVGTVLPLGAIASYTVHIFWIRPDRADAAGRGGSVPAAAAVAIAVVSIAFNIAFHAEHVLPDAEPGVIVDAARQLSTSGEIAIAADRGPFATARVGYASSGFEGRGADGVLRSRVPHLLPSLGGVAGWFGDTGLFVLSPVLGGIGLVTFYWLAARLVRPRTAVVLTLLLAASIPFVLIARDAYPELIVLPFLAGGLGVVWDESPSYDPSRAVLAGLLLGCAALARPEWTLLGVPLIIWVVIEWRTSQGYVEQRKHRRFLALIPGVFAVPVIVAWLDARSNRVQFIEAVDLRAAVGTAVTVAVFAGMARLARASLGTPRFAWVEPRRAAAALLAAALILTGLVGIYLRPEAHGDRPSPVVEMVQEAEGSTVDGTRTYAEETGRWLGWYLGPAAPVLGLIGIAGMASVAVAFNDRRPYLFLLVTVVMSFAFLGNPGADPVQVGVMRHFLPITLPAVLVGLGWLFDRVMDQQWRWQEASRSAGVLVLGLHLVVVALLVVPVAAAADQRGAHRGIRAACEAIGGSGAVVVLDGSDPALGQLIAEPVRGFCRVPVARAENLSRQEVEALAAGWSAQRRNLVLVASSYEDISPEVADLAGGALHPTVVGFTYTSPRSTLTAVPDGTIEGSFEFIVVPLGY